MSKYHRKAEPWRIKFLNSKNWKQLRLKIIARDKYKCAECGEVIGDIPEVHHTIELTEDNYTDPMISLNHTLLETLHHECHDLRHNRFGQKKKDTIVNNELEIDYERR